MSNKTNKKDVGAIIHKKGVSFRVWAPFAKTVAVTGSFNDWSRNPMKSENDGYWFVDIIGAQAGQEYKYIINDGKVDQYKNDPRSLQVTTSAGNSVIADTGFDWGDVPYQLKLFNEHVIYELHVGTFARVDAATTGRFNDVTDKLDYLEELGVTAIELMPINSMAMDRGWGYATDYIYAIESLYGGRTEFLEFVKAAHSRGIAVILDVVYNHFGPDDHLDLWQFDGWSQDNKGGIYFYNDWRSNTPWGETRPDFGRNEVRQYILDNARMWMEQCRLDGLRLDSTIFIRNVKGNNDDPENDLPDGWSLLQEVSTLAKKINPGALLIAEDVGANEYLTKNTHDGGAGFNAQWGLQFPAILRNVLEAVHDEDRNLTGLCNVLMQRNNGDAFQRVIYSDSHDSAANGGARLSEEIAPGDADNVYARRRSLLASSIVLTAPGIPMLFQGQEFMEDGSFNDWQALDWDKPNRFPGIVLASKHLIALRKNIYGNTRGLIGQNFAILHLNEESKLLAYHRWELGGPTDDVIIVINFANKMQKDYTINFPRSGEWLVRFNSDWRGYSNDFKSPESNPVVVTGNAAALTVAPYSVLILSQNN
jgi:1,4-alpha-glucan branching enzyme